MDIKLPSISTQDTLRAFASYPITVLVSLGILYILHVRYNTPLRHVPGPFWASITRLWKVMLVKSGKQPQLMVKLHQKYGSLVRTGPNEVSVSDPDAVKQIYGVGTNFQKSSWYTVWDMGPGTDKWDLFSDIDGKRHAQNKRMVVNSYSMTSMIELEPYVQQTINAFFRQLGEYADAGQPIDLAPWLQWFAFDNIGEITFGKRFGFVVSNLSCNISLKFDTQNRMLALISERHLNISKTL